MDERPKSKQAWSHVGARPASSQHKHGQHNPDHFKYGAGVRLNKFRLLGYRSHWAFGVIGLPGGEKNCGYQEAMLEIFRSMSTSYLEKTKGFITLWMLLCAATFLFFGMIDMDIYIKSMQITLAFVFVTIITGLVAIFIPDSLRLYDLLFSRTNTFIVPAVIDTLAYIVMALLSVGCYFAYKIRH